MPTYIYSKVSMATKINLPAILQKSAPFAYDQNNAQITVLMQPNTSNYTFMLPRDIGAQGQFLKTSGTNYLYWSNLTIPSYNTSQRLNMKPEIGTLVYDTDLFKAMLYDGSTWLSIGGSGGGGGTVFDDNTFRIASATAATKKIAFNCSNIASATTRTISMPNRDVDLNFASLMDQSVTSTSTPTFSAVNLLETGGPSYISITPPALASNYTLTLPTGLPSASGILQASAAGICTFTRSPTLETAIFTPSGSPNSITLQPPALVGSYSLTLPNSSGSTYQFAQLSAPGILSWGSELPSTFNIFDSLAPTKKVNFDVSNITPGNTRVVTIPDQDVDFTYSASLDQFLDTSATPTWPSINLAGNSQTAAISASPAASGSYTITLPPAVNTSAGMLLKSTDAAGTLAWTTNTRLDNLTDAEITQLENINGNVIAAANWTRLAALDQSVSSLSSPAWVSPMAKTSLKIKDPGVGSFSSILQAPTLLADVTMTLPTSNPSVLSNLQGNSSGQLTWQEDYENASNIDLYQFPATVSVSGGGLALKNAIAADDGTGTSTAPHVYEITDSLTYTDDSITSATVDLTNKHDIVIRGAIGQRPVFLCTAVLTTSAFSINYTAAGAGTTRNITLGNMTVNIVGSTSNMGFFYGNVQPPATTANSISDIKFKDIFIYGTEYTISTNNFGIVFNGQVPSLTSYISNIYVEDCKFLNIKSTTDRAAIHCVGVTNYIGRRNSFSAPNLAGSVVTTGIPPCVFKGCSGKEYYSTISPAVDNQFTTANQAVCYRVLTDGASSTYSGRGNPVTFTLYGCVFANCSAQDSNGALRLTYRPDAGDSKSFTIIVKKCSFVDSKYAGISIHGTNGAQIYEGISLIATDCRWNNVPFPIVNAADYDQPYKSLVVERNIYHNCGAPFTDLGAHLAAIPVVNVGLGEEKSLYAREGRYLRSALTDGYLAGANLNPIYNGATITRHNYMNLANPLGTSTVTDATVMRFDAAAGTHKATAAASIKADPTNVNGGWVKVNLNGTLGYIPIYLSP